LPVKPEKSWALDNKKPAGTRMLGEAEMERATSTVRPDFIGMKLFYDRLVKVSTVIAQIARLYEGWPKKGASKPHFQPVGGENRTKTRNQNPAPPPVPGSIRLRRVISGATPKTPSAKLSPVSTARTNG
jgi:hypothetical protein